MHMPSPCFVSINEVSYQMDFCVGHDQDQRPFKWLTTTAAALRWCARSSLCVLSSESIITLSYFVNKLPSLCSSLFSSDREEKRLENPSLGKVDHQ